MSPVIHINGFTASKLQAARALSEVDTGVLGTITVMDEAGKTVTELELYSRQLAYGSILTEPQVNWAALGSVSAATARLVAEAITLAAEISELATELAVPASEPVQPGATVIDGETGMTGTVLAVQDGFGSTDQLLRVELDGEVDGMSTVERMSWQVTASILPV